jgi:ribonuclease D
MDASAHPSTGPLVSFTPPPYTWVDTAVGFHEALEVLTPVTRLAIDVEADSLYHYFEKVCLIQISTDQRTFLLDPLALGSMLQDLAPIMADPAVEKVFHAATYDIICLRRDCGYQLRGIFDTHLAAQLLGYEQLGLSALLEKLIGVAYVKDCQRDDWSRRPLLPEQMEYAAMDTHHLLRLRDVLELELSGKGRLAWAEEECRIASLTEIPEREFDPEGFRRIRTSQGLSSRELAILRALYLLRDRCARILDVPAFKVINNSILIELARKPPRSVRDLIKRRGISQRVGRRFSGEILEAIARVEADDAPPPETAPRSHWKPPSKEARLRLDRLKQWRLEKGRELALHVGVIFPGNLLEALSASPPDDLAALGNVPGMRQWRLHQFGADIITILHSI